MFVLCSAGVGSQLSEDSDIIVIESKSNTKTSLDNTEAGPSSDNAVSQADSPEKGTSALEEIQHIVESENPDRQPLGD